MNKLTVLDELLQKLQNGEIVFENQEEAEKHLLDIRRLTYEGLRKGEVIIAKAISVKIALFSKNYVIY